MGHSKISDLKSLLLLFPLLLCFSCKEKTEKHSPEPRPEEQIRYAEGFQIEKRTDDLTVIQVASPWPGADRVLRYALVKREKLATTTLNRDQFDAIIPVPVTRIIATSTTHVPALETLGVAQNLVGFPDTKYISSPYTRSLIDQGKIVDIGSNETLNTEMSMGLEPELVIGFTINGDNPAYMTLKRAGIPVVYNGEWTETTPLGKAEWIKFYGPFFGKEALAAAEFEKIEKAYLNAKQLTQKTGHKPTVLSGALYKDVWYLPGGESWAAQFIEDAGARYLWGDTPGTGSLSLGIEAVLAKGREAAFWISPSQYTTYTELSEGSRHYEQFRAFKERKVFTFALTKGPTGGLLYYEQAPGKPHEVLMDLIAIFHPEILPGRDPYFFKPLEK